MADIIVRQVTRNIMVSQVGRRGPQGEQGIPGDVTNVPVTSVNGLLGDVVLDTDDISEATNKYVTAAEKTKLSNLSGTNTGDQDLSGYVPTTRTVNGHALSSNVTVTKSDIGLGNADNTSDANKPISSATQAALDAIESGDVDSVNGATGVVVLNQDDIGDGTTYKQYSQTEKTKLSGIATGATANSSDATLLARANHTGTQLATTISDFSTAADARVAAAASTGTGSLVRSSSPLITTPTGIVKGDVGLGSVDNTADTAKPVSTAQQTALNLKANLASPTFTGTPAAPTAAAATNTTQLATTAHVFAERSNTVTLTNKRITPRVSTTASSATPTPNADTDDHYTVTALATNATFGAPTGTPTDGQNLTIRILDNGTARTLAWNAIYRPITITMPSTTVISKTMYLGMKYNSADTRWDVLAYGLEA